MSKFNFRMSTSAVALATALIVAGCAVTQPIPPKYDLPPGSATPAQNEALKQYWTLFNDPVLDQLVAEALANNLDLKASLARIEAARKAIEARAGRLPDLELRTVEVPEAGNQGTRLFSALERALADVPRARLAGVVALTDGQAHDVPEAVPIDAPFHALLPGRPGETDRRLRLAADGIAEVG